MASASLKNLQDEIDKRVTFITRYEALGESHMVDFLVSDHWNRLVHPSAQKQLLQLKETDLYSLSDATGKLDFPKVPQGDVQTCQHLIEDLEHYLKDARDCGISSTGLCRTMADISARDGISETKIPQESMCKINTKEYMCSKKSHEVEKMSEFVNLICKAFNIKDILDFGSGKGYLGAYLALRYGLSVTGIDCSETNSANALKRAKKYLKYWNAYLKNKSDSSKSRQFTENLEYRPLTAYVDGNFDIASIIRTDDAEPVNKTTMLTGLHTCGDLSSMCLRTFARTPTIKAVCAVGCCYHHLTAPQDDVDSSGAGFPLSTYLRARGFSLGRNSRMLGLRALEKTENTQSTVIEEKSTRSLFYRAVFSVILKEEFGIDCRGNTEIQIGKTYSKSKDFPDYVRKCLHKLGMQAKDPSGLSDEKICWYMQSYQSSKKSLMGYNVLREAFAPAVEALILLDRLLYLEEQRTESDPMTVHLVRLFDPVVSPRCYAIVAMRDARQLFL